MRVLNSKFFGIFPCPCPSAAEHPWKLCRFLAQLVFKGQLCMGITTSHEALWGYDSGNSAGNLGLWDNSWETAKLTGNPKSGRCTENNLCAALSAQAPGLESFESQMYGIIIITTPGL